MGAYGMPEPWESEWRDYYALLECAPGISARQIRSAFRRLAKKYHPDVSHDNGERFKRIAEAYEILSNAERRRAYDLACARVKHGFSPRPDLIIEPAQVVIRARGRRLAGHATLHGLSPDMRAPLDVSIRDPDVELRRVRAQWVPDDDGGGAMHVAWEAELIGRGRRFEMVYTVGGTAAVQSIVAHTPRFVLHETVATPAGRRTYVFGLRWLDISRERVQAIPVVGFFVVVFTAVMVGDANQHTAAVIVAWSGAVVDGMLFLVFLNAYFATNGAWRRIRRGAVPIAIVVVLFNAIQELVRALH